MDQKLQNLLYSLPTRTAWIITGSCAAFWILCLTGVLTPPVSAPPNITLFWFYTMLMLILASGLAVIGAAAALVLKHGVRAEPGPTSAAEPGWALGGTPPAETDGGPDQLAGLSRMLDDPGNLAGRQTQAAAPAPAPEPALRPGSPPPRRPAQGLATPKRKRRRRR